MVAPWIIVIPVLCIGLGVSLKYIGSAVIDGMCIWEGDINGQVLVALLCDAKPKPGSRKFRSKRCSLWTGGGG